MSPTDAPIGVFDSGFGGLTVARALVDQLPSEDLLYLGDTARAPYGPLPIDVVREYALECLDHLAEQGVKAMVIACNSASSAMLRDARQRYDVPVVDVILPAARRAARTTRNRRIGVICTEATASSGAYADALGVAPVEITTQACPRFVELIEAGVTSGPELLAVAEEYLAPVRAAGVDTLVLGCTHYPLLTGVISYLLGPEVTLVSSADEGADHTYATLLGAGLLRAEPGRLGRHEFITTGAPDAFAGIGRRLVGEWVGHVRQFS
ncbi:glutamate racemase [Auraticoccus monumenti]|uniref:glutamate racemase n=1 Tax=Auraticoccus monumenti TaxID=675864 RepID=UPI000B835CB1|nr:glutamate racemase [Auraticoccus monumenti]